MASWKNARTTWIQIHLSAIFHLNKNHRTFSWALFQEIMLSWVLLTHHGGYSLGGFHCLTHLRSPGTRTWTWWFNAGQIVTIAVMVVQPCWAVILRHRKTTAFLGSDGSSVEEIKKTKRQNTVMNHNDLCWLCSNVPSMAASFCDDFPTWSMAET